MNDRVDIERRRLTTLAHRAGLPGPALWREAVELARTAPVLHEQSPCVQMRRLLDAAGVDHRAVDEFGTLAPSP